MALISTQASVGFDLDTRDRVIIEYDTAFLFDGGIPIRVFPAYPDVVKASVGEVVDRGVRELSIQGEAIKYQRSSEASLKYPGAYALQIKDPIFFDDLANPISPSLIYQSQQDAVFAKDSDNRLLSVTGGAFVDYRVLYRTYDYYPKRQYASSWRGLDVRYGYALAIKGKAVAILEINPVSLGSTDKIELYRVTSQIVADPDGAWEKPPDFPSSALYPAIGDAGGPDTAQFFIDERAHEYGYLNRRGYVTYDMHMPDRFKGLWVERPYAGRSNIPSSVPVYSFEAAINPQSAPAEFENALSRVDWSRIKTAIADRWPGVEGL